MSLSYTLSEFTRNHTEAGQILVIDKGIYTHWGVYAGGNYVIDCPGGSGSLDVICDVNIRRVSLSEFQGDSPSIKVCKVNAGRRSLQDSVEAAKARVGDLWNYRVLTNNCMHFAFQCRANIGAGTRNQAPWALDNVIANAFIEF
jgi:hypothetical protein